MKKRISMLLVFLLVFCFLAGCDAQENFSEYPFVNINWERSTENDTEFIRFYDSGEFSYYCACGNPVNDSDLCEGYSYNVSTGIITLDYTEKTKETVTKVILKKVSDDELVLEFDGEVRTFSKSREKTYLDSLSYDGKEYSLITYNSDIFNYDLAKGVEYEEDEILKIPHDKWDIVYYNGDLFVLNADISEVNSYYSNDKNYTWWVRVENIETETQYTVELSLVEAEIEYIYKMDSMPREETIFFEDIKQFATLGKTSNDGLISATTELVWRENGWYWRSEIIDESTEGWPEFIIELPKALSDRITPPQN